VALKPRRVSHPAGRIAWCQDGLLAILPRRDLLCSKAEGVVNRQQGGIVWTTTAGTCCAA